MPATAAGQAGCRAKARGRAYYKTFCLGFKLEKHPSPLFQAEFSSRLCRAGTSLHPAAQRGARPAPGCGAEPRGTPGLCMGHPLAWAAVAVGRGLAPAPSPTRQQRRSPLPPAWRADPSPGQVPTHRCLLGNVAARRGQAPGICCQACPAFMSFHMWQWNKGKNIKLTYSFHFSGGQLFKKQTNKKAANPHKQKEERNSRSSSALNPGAVVREGSRERLSEELAGLGVTQGRQQ